MGAQSPMNNANRSPCAGSSGEIRTHVAIDTSTEARDAVKHTFESCFLSIFFSLFWNINIVIIIGCLKVYKVDAGAGFEPTTSGL